VNNKPCNNPTYVVSTTYAGAGQSRVTFDCSNVINKAGSYDVIIQPTQANTGTISGWLDLTYMNDPAGDMDIFGTEYSPNDPATIFLQLKDADGNPIQNGLCYLDMWYPLTVNNTHPYTIQDAPMMKAEGDDGLYYYDLTAPSTLGVYMLSSKCSYSLLGGFVYGMTGVETHKPNRTVIQGTYVGDTIFLNDFEDWIYTDCASTGGGVKNCEAQYDFDTKIHWDNMTNFTNINLYYMGEASVKATTSFYFWNWTNSSWKILPNNLTYSGLASSVPIGIGDFASNEIPSSRINDIRNSTTGIIRIKTLSTFGNSFSTFDNWLNIELKSAEGQLQDLKGSGEMHITNIPNATIFQVWNYTNRSLTDNGNQLIAQKVWNYSGTINPTLLSQIAGSIWNWSGSIASNILNLFSSDVWNFASRNLTYTPDQNITTQIVNVTNQTVNVTYQTVNVTDVNLTVINQTVNVTTEVVNVTNQTVSVTNVTATDIAQQVWDYNGTVSNNLLNQVAGSVWNWTGSITSNILDLISGSNWLYPNRNLTYTPDQNISTQVVNVTNQTVNVTDVNLTILNQTINVTTQIINVTNQTVNVNNVSVDEDAIADAVWTHTPDRNLTNYETSNVNVTINGSDVASQVWNYNGTINDNLLNQIAGKVQCYVQQLFSTGDDQWVVDISAC